MFLKSIINLLLTFIVVLLAFSCKHNNKNLDNEFENSDSTLENETILIKPIKIFGKTDDLEAFEYFNFIDNANIYGNKPSGFAQIISSDSLYITLDSIEKPRIMGMMMFGKRFYSSPIFITPGDSVSLHIENGSMRFTGKNSSQYNFYYFLDSINNQWSKNAYLGNLQDYKKRSKDLYIKRLSFYNSFISKNKVSISFKEQIKAELKFEYIYNLIAPRSIYVKETNSYVNDLQSITNTLEDDGNVTEDNFINFADYYDNISIADFNHPELVNNDYFKRSLSLLIRYYFTNQDYIGFTEENFVAELSYIQKNLQTDVAYYAEGKVIADYFEKGFGQDKITNPILKKEINNYLKKSIPSSYRETISDINNDLKKLNFAIPDNIRNEKLLTVNNDTITFNQLLDKNEHIKFISFWAYFEAEQGRCEQCILGMKKLNNIRATIEPEYKTDWIYISIDNDTKRWKQHLKLLNNIEEEFTHYKILNNNMTSKILSYFKVVYKQPNSNKKVIELPRYIMIDKDKNLLLNNIPQPTDSLAFKNVLKTIFPKE